MSHSNHNKGICITHISLNRPTHMYHLQCNFMLHSVEKSTELKEELADKEKLAMHSHQLHKQIKENENEIKKLLIKVQVY